MRKRKLYPYRGDEYRSKAELGFAKRLYQSKIKFWYEKLKLKWLPKVKERVYTPDFHFKRKDGSVLIVEYKGHFDLESRKKMEAIIEQHPDEDIRMVFMNANSKIYKGSKTTYGDWCDKRGILWADNELPDEWLKPIAKGVKKTK